MALFGSRPIGRYYLESDNPFTIGLDGKDKRFVPSEWLRVGVGFNYGHGTEFDEFEALFLAGGSWLLLGQVQPPCADDVFGDPMGQFISREDAAKWCALHDVPLPAELAVEFVDEFHVVPSIQMKPRNKGTKR